MPRAGPVTRSRGQMARGSVDRMETLSDCHKPNLRGFVAVYVLMMTPERAASCYYAVPSLDLILGAWEIDQFHPDTRCVRCYNDQRDRSRREISTGVHRMCQDAQSTEHVAAHDRCHNDPLWCRGDTVTAFVTCEWRASNPSTPFLDALARQQNTRTARSGIASPRPSSNRIVAFVLIYPTQLRDRCKALRHHPVLVQPWPTQRRP